MNTSSAHAQDFVTAAVVAAHIHTATHHAQEMALVAKNARAIALRAGDLAMGFRPITNFIEEIARQTTQSAATVNHLSLVIARIAVSRARLESFHRRLGRARQLCEGQTLSPRLEQQYNDTGQALAALQRDSEHKLLQLQQLLDDAVKEIRAANVIATAARVEASRAGSSKLQLEQVANNIEQAAISIRGDLGKAMQMLN
jgi:uncharacterized phage infection (PIP) family protein YhgE